MKKPRKKKSMCVKYVIVLQDLFDRAVNAKRVKAKVCKVFVGAFFKMITRKKRPKKNWVNKGFEIAGEFRKVCRAEIQFHCTMSETKTALLNVQYDPWKPFLYHYMEDHGYQYISKLSQFVTTMNSEKNCSIDLMPKKIDFSSILWSKLLWEFTKPDSRLETNFASRSMIYPSERVRNHSVRRMFLKLLQFLPENLKHTQQKMNRMRF